MPFFSQKYVFSSVSILVSFWLLEVFLKCLVITVFLFIQATLFKISPNEQDLPSDKLHGWVIRLTLLVLYEDLQVSVPSVLSGSSICPHREMHQLLAWKHHRRQVGVGGMCGAFHVMLTVLSMVPTSFYSSTWTASLEFVWFNFYRVNNLSVMGTGQSSWCDGSDEKQVGVSLQLLVCFKVFKTNPTCWLTLLPHS